MTLFPRKLRIILFAFILLFVSQSFAETYDGSRDAQTSPQELKIELGGAVGRQFDRVVENWLVRAPSANPALLSVFQLRDRAPQTDAYYVPWVGEFVGKYLTSATLATGLSDSSRLREVNDAVARAFMASQDKDGYLGPFPHEKRLLVGWDLWGHYHAIHALLERYRLLGDEDALVCARRAADLICATFHDGAKRPKDVGSDEMNLAALTALARLYGVTGESRYLETAQVFLEDLKSCGDFYRAGLERREFFQTARPRWESLHTIMGLGEMYRVTGDASYREAFWNLYESIARRDVHHNGSFSCGEQAVGTPYRNGAIETCCTVAWIALSVEALRLSGDSICADRLENSLYNAVCAYTHPSGSWCAYNTPQNGRREASFHTIVFQARPGQPELNCCSVNGPRGFGELFNWAITEERSPDGEPSLCVNYYGPMRATFRFDNERFTLVQETDYPRDGRIAIRIVPDDPNYKKPISLKLRIPSWARNVALIDSASPEQEIDVPSGEYYTLKKTWSDEDYLVLQIPIRLRYEVGDGDFADKICLFYGPTLLAYDQLDNVLDPENIAIDRAALDDAVVTAPKESRDDEIIGRYAPLVRVETPTRDSRAGSAKAVFRDVATAGAQGETYQTWFSGLQFEPPAPAQEFPEPDAVLPPGAIRFGRRGSSPAHAPSAVLLVSESPSFDCVATTLDMAEATEAFASPEMTSVLQPGKKYFWKIVASNAYGSSESSTRSFHIDSKLEPFDWRGYQERLESNRTTRPLIVDALKGEANPSIGRLERANHIEGFASDASDRLDAVAFNGVDSEIVYALDDFPAVDYEASLMFMTDVLPEKDHIAQIISAWTKGMDDPLRVAIDDLGNLYGAIESREALSSPRVPITLGRWYRLRVVKNRDSWRLELDDNLVGELQVDEISPTTSSAIGLGCNPRFRERSEFFSGKIKDFRLLGRVAP